MKVYNNTIAELQNSKAKLVENITKQLEANYSKQIENLSNNVEILQKANERDVNVLNQQLLAAKEEKQAFSNQIQDLQKKVEKAGRTTVYMIILIIAALVLGWLLAKKIMY